VIPANEVLQLFEQTGAYLRGHFRLTSGLHSPEYMQCALLLQYPEYAEQLGRNLAHALRSLVGESAIDVVASPAIGGLIIGHEVARALGARHIFAERDASGRMILRRGLSAASGERAVVVEDVITTGGSSREVIQLLRESGANVVAAASIVDRSGGRASLEAPHTALVTLGFTSYPPDECPLCRQGLPVEKPGSRPVLSR